MSMGDKLQFKMLYPMIKKEIIKNYKITEERIDKSNEILKNCNSLVWTWSRNVRVTL